ncbi:MAG: type VI secretion system tip protein VgrG [Planctomycetes bacterium]|nr:type VI secretion system tip protein VgrG [Planctomycetota bacterium]
MARTQAQREVAIITPLGGDVLLLRRMTATEHMGRLFAYEVELLSEDANIAFGDILGKNATVRVLGMAAEPRYFNGYVSRFVQVGVLGSLTQYSATLVPWLWFLTRTSDCRIFQNMKVPDIIAQVFGDFGFSDFERRLNKEYRIWEYCVQYRESAFDFISRLMEQEGIYYYFRAENGKHTLVLSDADSSHDPYPEYDSIRYHHQGDVVTDYEYISDWSFEQAVQSGACVLSDFDFKNPKTSLKSRAEISRSHDSSGFEVYDYPGEYTTPNEGEACSRLRIEQLHSNFEVATGQGNARGIATGFKFELTDHPRTDQCREYLVTSTSYEVESDEYDSSGRALGTGPNYKVQFTAVEAQTPFRSASVTSKPTIPGPQTAMVVGSAGEEIDVDEYGRVKVQFHWDRYGEADDNSSCWVRVAQVWAGKKWGAMYIPRIGQEVVVEFLEGDPDRPLITGRVYNGVTMPPYELPANKTISTLKSNSSKGGEGFNEVRFEDKKGEEQMFVHAEKNQDIRVKNDCFEWIGKNRHLIVKTDQFEHVKNNRHEMVDADHMEEIGKDRHLNIKGKEAKAVTGSHSFTVSGDVIEVFKANHSEQTTQNYYLKAMGVVIEATTGITLKCGGNSVVIDTMGVTVKGSIATIEGSMVKINSGPGSPAASGSAGSVVTPAAPTEAEEADKADPGEVAEIKAEQRQTKSGKYGAVPVKPFKPPTEEQAEEQKTSWIEIEMVDENDAPVTGEEYKVTLPDGETVAEGTLDDKGFARIDGIDPGNCKITFPNLDQEAWELA